jgi:hypothetical protein
VPEPRPRRRKLRPKLKSLNPRPPHEPGRGLVALARTELSGSCGRRISHDADAGAKCASRYLEEASVNSRSAVELPLSAPCLTSPTAFLAPPATRPATKYVPELRFARVFVKSFEVEEVVAVLKSCLSNQGTQRRAQLLVDGLLDGLSDRLVDQLTERNFIPPNQTSGSWYVSSWRIPPVSTRQVPARVQHPRECAISNFHTNGDTTRARTLRSSAR